MRSSALRAVVSVVTILFVCAMLGGVFGNQVHATSAEVAVPDSDASLHLFTNLLGMVEDNYAAPVDPDQSVYGAIDGMLRTLDPHSKFFNPKAFRSLREDQTGKYYGLGISVTTRFGKVTVVSPPFPNSPAERAGLRVGDQIIKIDGEPTDTLDINAVVSRLKGQKGTAVNITIARPGNPTVLEIPVIRDEIMKYTINNAYRIRPGIGYIHLESFAETSGNELREALKKIDYKTLDGLVFDLRDNPGGVLTEAIEVAETFLQKGQVILETRGRSGGRAANHPYVSQRANTENLYPLVVLVNQGSASASEIVSGAIQDHDRGLIIGETSFGKGLVQSVYNLNRGAGLALTTQKWYTPSGRLIQRDYSQISQFDYMYHRDNAEQKPKTDIKYSDLGRIVYGGGGITPDHVVPAPKSNDFQELLVKKYAFFTFVRDFLAKNPPIDLSFQVSDAMVNDFKAHLQKRKLEFSGADFDANRDYIRQMIHAEVFYNRLGTVEADRVRLAADPQVAKALEYMAEAKDMQTKARRQVAQQR